MTGGSVFLRRPAIADVDLLIEASRDDDIIRWTRMPSHLDREAASALLARWQTRAIDGTARQYVICPAAKDAPVGVASLILQDPADPWNMDVVYWLLPRGRHLGLVSGAVQLLLQWAFRETAARRAALYTLEGNVASEGVALRNGFHVDRIVEETEDGRTLRLKRWRLERGTASGQPPASAKT